MSLHTPVAIIVFKRLDATQKMFEAVRKAQPHELFIIGDGWRTEEEKVKCLAVRDYLAQAVDWPCLVRTNYADTNIGLKKRIVSGLNWVFEQVDRAIILEDDCIPDPTFFPFCEELLERYKDEPRVMQIAAMNVQEKNKRFSTNGESYYFSQFGEIWGWATWRRAWQLYDAELRAWPEAKHNGLLNQRIKDEGVVDHFIYRFDYVREAGDDRSKSDVWGAQWIFTQLLHNGLSIVPKTNLVSNVGDSPDATHPKGQSDFVRMQTIPLAFPLIHPKKIEVNESADHYSLRVSSGIKKKLSQRVLFFFKQHTPRLYKKLSSLYRTVR